MVKLILTSLFLLLGCEVGSLNSISHTELIEVKIEYYGQTFVNIERPNIDGLVMHEKGRGKGHIYFNYKKGSIYSVGFNTTSSAQIKIFENEKVIYNKTCFDEGCKLNYMGVAGE